MTYRGEIDGLRALAVLPVILFHAGLPMFGGGYVGVDVFFVISGYLISTILLRELDEGRFSLLRFYERRARRILPALFTVMLVSLPFAWFWLMPRDLKEFSDSLVAVTFFVSNFLFWLESGYFESTAELKPLLHTWSLAVEEQYYIVFPLLLMALVPLGRRALLAGLLLLFALSLGLSHWGIYNRPSATFFLLPARGWELLTGVFVALHQRQARGPRPHGRWAELLSVAGLLMIIAPIFLYSEDTPFPGVYALPPTIGTALVLAFARPGTLVHRALALKPLVALGLISYAAYLWHQPVFAFYKHRFGLLSFDENVAALIALSLALATLSYWIVERPFRRRASLPQLGAALATAILVIAGAATAFFTTLHEDFRSLPTYQWALENASPALLSLIMQEDVKAPCPVTEPDIALQHCRFGAPGQAPTIALWGDSLAAAMLHGMDHAAREEGLAGVAFAVDGCPPLPGLDNADMVGCTGKTHARVMAQIAAIPTLDTLVIAGNFGEVVDAANVTLTGKAATAGSLRVAAGLAVEALARPGLRTVFVQPGPIFRIPVAEYEIQSLRNGSQKPQVLPRAALEADLTPVRALSDLYDVYVDTLDFYCSETACSSVDARGRPIFYDRNHVTPEHSLRLARLVFRRMDAAD